MKKIDQPKKQPEAVRQRIIEQTIRLASIKGIDSISIQHIADSAGITKGGLFHHFANKKILIHEMMSQIIAQLDATVEHIIQNDPDEYGKFTRAYIQIALDKQGSTSPWNALAMTMLTDHTFNFFWQQWINNKLIQYQLTDHHLELELIRLATDGLWLKNMTHSNLSIEIKNELIQRTYP